MADVDLFERRLATTAAGVHLFMLVDEVRMDPGNRIWEGPSGNGNHRTLRDEMWGLKADLGRLANGWLPDDELAGAPRLEAWGITFRDGELLWRVIGDPYDAACDLPGVADGETLCTMQILAVDDGFTWARDRRGFYRLGEPRGWAPPGSGRTGAERGRDRRPRPPQAKVRDADMSRGAGGQRLFRRSAGKKGVPGAEDLGKRSRSTLGSPEPTRNGSGRAEAAP